MGNVLWDILKFLAAVVIIVVAVFLLYTFIVHIGRRRAWLRPLLSVRGKKILRTALTVTAAAVFVTARALALSQPRGRAYDYSMNDSSLQKDADILFTKEPDREELKKLDIYRKLHLEEGFIGETRFAGMLQYYETLFQSVFPGVCSPDKPAWEPLESGDYLSIRTPYLQEAQDWQEKYRATRWPDRLYQCGRALNDAAMELNGISFFLMLEVAADAVSSEERFLAYGRRNVSSRDNPVFIEPEDIALMNGKLLLRLAEYADAHPEGEPYVNCLLAQAYHCFLRGRSCTSPHSPLYAKLTYYMGITGERILERMSRNDEPILYQSLGTDTLAYYQSCIKLLERYPGFYERESNMLKNAKDGAATLNGLGFR